MQEYEYVYQVYKEKSFSRAAKNLFISQPALSATIKKIETRLGVQLFERTTTSVTLTEAGEAYIDTAKKIMELESDLAVYLEDLSNLNTGRLVLAGTAFFCSYVIPPVVSAYQKKYPGVTLEMTESDSLLLYDMAGDNDLDLIVDAGHYDTEKFDGQTLFTEHILLAVPEKMVTTEYQKKLALTAEDVRKGRFLKEETPGISVGEFMDCPFILLKKEHDLFHKAMAVCEESGIQPESLLHLNQLMTAYSLVCQGMGVTFVSDTLVRQSRMRADVVYFKLDVRDPELTRREVFVAWRRNRHVTRTMNSFVQTAQKIYHNYMLEKHPSVI